MYRIVKIKFKKFMHEKNHQQTVKCCTVPLIVTLRSILNSVLKTIIEFLLSLNLKTPCLLSCAQILYINFHADPAKDPTLAAQQSSQGSGSFNI